MTWLRYTSGVLIGLLLLAGPAAAAPALSFLPVPANSEEDDEAAPTELTLALDLSLHGRRPAERPRPADRPRTAVIPPHRRHATPFRPQAAPVTFRAAANAPLHC